MSRFYVPKDAVREGAIFVSGDEAHHILDVMRLKVSDEVVAFDGSGKEYIGFVKEAGRKSLTIQISRTREAAGIASKRLTLIQAIPKKEKMDYIVEKATELGVGSIVPMITERTIVRWDDDKKDSAVKRWQRIAREAAKQCGRLDIPVIEPVRSFAEIAKDIERYDRVLLAALSDGAIGLRQALKDFNGKDIAVAIGPEGDFTPDEIKSMRQANVTLVNLGRLVLKSDTAGLAVLAILSYELSN